MVNGWVTNRSEHWKDGGVVRRDEANVRTLRAAGEGALDPIEPK